MKLRFVPFYVVTIICCTYCTAAFASIGPFEIVSADSSSRIRFQFAGQLRTDIESLDSGSDNSRSNDLFMKARRLRPTVSVRPLKPNLLFRLHLSTAPGSLELMDFYFNYQIAQHLQFRYGQYKVPFTRYRIQSFQRLTFVDWAIVTKIFGAERQMGFALHNGYEKPPRWGYALGVFTGVNARASHTVYLPQVYGEDINNPSDLADPGPKAEFHPELFLHVSYNARDIRMQSDTDEKRTGFRYSVGLSAAWDVEPTAYRDIQIRLAPEFLMKYRGLSVFTAGYAGFIEVGDPVCTDLGMVGGLVQAAYRVNDRYEVSVRYAVVDFEDVIVDDAYDRARQLIARMEDLLDTATAKELAQQNLDNIIARYGNAGLTLREQEITLGFNIYTIGHSLKWQNDFGRLRHKRRDGTLNDYIARSQFQLTF